ncbi:uncharacterized protein H6S33_011783 [Morchella sextelata]|uniref:uncharacterized protein n=1 Tax=Morchella sextelata TaxID=1174677 RepID=UPI001D054D3F|nr:uncharacterized protein H6S33_011783 [Morchella sextelata]KAH0610256.1 hypothetical protein H6S33_011783 [Morchella sextelata]
MVPATIDSVHTVRRSVGIGFSRWFMGPISFDDLANWGFSYFIKSLPTAGDSSGCTELVTGFSQFISQKIAIASLLWRHH